MRIIVTFLLQPQQTCLEEFFKAFMQFPPPSFNLQEGSRYDCHEMVTKFCISESEIYMPKNKFCSRLVQHGQLKYSDFSVICTSLIH